MLLSCNLHKHTCIAAGVARSTQEPDNLWVWQRQYNQMHQHSVSHIMLLPPTTNAGDEMSLSNHGRILSDLFKRLGIQTTKKTHELRIYAAQLLYEMGVPLEVSKAVVVHKHISTYCIKVQPCQAM